MTCQHHYQLVTPPLWVTTRDPTPPPPPHTPPGGTKAVLLQRLEQGAPTTPTNTTHQSPSTSAASLDHKEEQLAQALGVASPSTPNTTPLPAPGTAHVGGVRTAAEAAVEKIAAGEGRHVEHVALHTPASDAVAVGGSTQKRKRKRQ